MTSIAPVPESPPVAATRAAAPPAGWTPATVVAVPSSRPPGILRSGIDAWRGKVELGNGQPLSGVQVAAFAPFLSKAFQLNEDAVRGDLQAVRLYTGGPAAPTPNMAVTMVRDIYVQGDSELQRIMRWDHRRWLAHELGHVMQWRVIPQADAPTDTHRTRRSIERYVGGLVLDGARGPGAVPRGIAWWIRDRVGKHEPGHRPKGLADAIHDSHHLEIEAEDHAREYVKSTEMSRQPPQA